MEQKLSRAKPKRMSLTRLSSGRYCVDLRETKAMELVTVKILEESDDDDEVEWDELKYEHPRL